MIRNQIQARAITTSTASTAYSKRFRMPPIVSQFAPSWTPANTSAAVHGSDPRNVKIVNRPTRHVRDAGRERHERADDRQHPPEEAGRLAVAGEERIGAVEVRGRDAEVPPPPLDDGSPAPGADRVGDERPDRRPERARQHRQPVVPGRAADRFEGGALADEEAGEREHDLGRDRDDDALDGDPQRHAEVADRLVDLGDQVADRPVQEVEHGREHSRLSSDP